MGSTHSQGKARIERIDGGTFLSDCAATATAESALLVSTGVVENITAGTFLGNGTAPAIGLSRYCETDTGEMGEGGRIQEISGGDMIASGTAPALYCAAQGSGVTLISGGFFYGDSAVLIDNDEDLVITGGVFYATDRVCIQIAKGRSARLYLEPQYTTFSASPSAKGRARYMVRNYLTEGVENKYLFEADKEEQIVFPIWGQIDGDKEVKPYDLSGQGVALEEGNALVADSMFRYLTPSP